MHITNPLEFGVVSLLFSNALAKPLFTRDTTSASQTDPNTQGAIDPSLYGCSVDQAKLVKEAWSEAGLLADAHAKWVNPGWIISGTYQGAMDKYMGTDSRSDSTFLGGIGELKKQIDRQRDIHEGSAGNPPRWTYAYFYCDENKMPGASKKSAKYCGGNTTAYTFDDLGFLWSAHYVVFCPLFFDATRVSSLAQQVFKANGKPELQRVMDPWRNNRARILFHETYHWGTTVSQPRCNLRPEVYQPANVVELAKKRNIAASRLNAESWTQAAMAIYVQETFGLSDPPGPKTPGSSSSLGSTSDDLEEFGIDKPDWFISPVPEMKSGRLGQTTSGYVQLSSS